MERQANFNALLLARQVQKCPMFATFHALYSEHPTIHPVLNVGMQQDSVEQGDVENQTEVVEVDDEEEEQQKGAEPATRTATPPHSSSDSKKSDKAGKESDQSTKTKTFKLKEGAKKVEFTQQWAATMGEAKAARLEFEKMKDAREQEARKRELEERAKDRAESAKRMKSELLMSLLQRNLSEPQIHSYMRMCGYSIEDRENFQN